MSSTNRMMVRQDADYYATDPAEIRKFFDKFFFLQCRPNDTYHGGPAKWLDCCAGGRKGLEEMAYPLVLQERGIEPDTMDIREDSRAKLIANYLEMPMLGYDVIISNPPFNLAIEFIKKAISEVNEHGLVIMLLRLNFWGSQTRLPFFEEYMPKYTVVHSTRMGFKRHLTHLPPKERNATDSIEYAHFIWQRGFYPEFTRLKVI